ncbi:MAG: glycosyltransferase family 2 protein [Eubacteriales bacterium]|nr:glycosyltransferase family 2 protein [Eubacteriales bacterium]
MEKLLTISVAAYNVEKYIGRALDSYINTCVLDYLDIIVVNDGSDDNTKKIVEEYERKYPNSIRLINQENNGHGSTINKSIQLAKGLYYKIVDSDDTIDKIGLEKLISFIKNNRNIDIIINPFNYYDFKTNNLISIKYPFVDIKSVIFNKEQKFDELNINDINIHSITTRTDILKQKKEKIDENCFYVDVEYVIFQLKYIKNCISFDYPIYNYYIGDTNQSINIENLIKRREMHKKVLFRLVNYYNENFNDFSEKTKDIIKNRIGYFMYHQYKIYLSMGKPKEELIKFDEELKFKNIDLYRGNDSIVMKIIRLNRLSGYKFINLFMKIFKIYEESVIRNNN